MKRDKNKYSIEFFLTDESFIDWVRGNDTLEPFWSTWIKEHPEAKGQFEEARFIASEINIEEDDIAPAWIEKVKGKIDSSIDSQTGFAPSIFVHRPASGNNNNRLKWTYLAASFLLIMGVSIVFAYYGNLKDKTAEPITHFKEAHTGQKLTFYLSDGSKVKLNSESSLHYTEFNDSSRIVYLKGEAFFDIVRDTLRPFTVVTDKVRTNVLGTSFNVNYQPDEKTVTVALVSGQVELHGKNTVKLEPGQIARSKEEQEIKFIDEDISRLTSWKDGVIIFEHASMQEVINELSRWYGVKFIVSGVNPEEIKWEYTGSFDNQSLQVVLMSLSYVKNFQYEIKRDSIYINY